MATQINNSVSATYAYGRSGSDTAVSNVATTNLIEEYAISGYKQSLNGTFRPGENVTYVVGVRNDGTSPLYSVTITDDLGGAGLPLSFVEGSAILNVNGVVSRIIPNSLSPLTFILTQPILEGDNATITYVARVNSALSNAISEITNTATITAREGSATGATIAVNPNPTTTLIIEEFALVNVTKDVSSNEILPGETFSYTITLENSGSLDATNVVLTDVLPEEFTVSSITSVTQGVQTVYNTADYTIDGTTNTLTVSTNPDKQISIPASNGVVSGVTVVTITGVFN